MSHIFDYDKFEKLINQVKSGYGAAFPYPYAIFDGLFDDKVISDINSEIDAKDFAVDSRSIDGVEVKVRSNFEDNESLPSYSRAVFEILNGGKFLNLLSNLTGIAGLISDPYYDGGGINFIENGGTLAVHVDGTHQRRMRVCRRLNAILFVNDYWDPEWNGYHEQWVFKRKELSPFDPQQEWQCVRKILPKKNRLLVFTTNDHSWHGHAGVLNVPSGTQRRSLITYYYTVDRPVSDLAFESPHRALFVNNNVTLTEGAFEGVEIVL